MIITVVTFYAYNQLCTEAFLDRTNNEIHEALLDVCATYQLVAINAGSIKALAFQSLNPLLELPRPEPKSSPVHLQWALGTVKNVES